MGRVQKSRQIEGLERQYALVPTTAFDGSADTDRQQCCEQPGDEKNYILFKDSVIDKVKCVPITYIIIQL